MQRICDSFFRNLGTLLGRRAYPAVVCMVLAALLLSSPLSDLKVDPSLRNYLGADDPRVADYERFLALFGSDERIVIGAGAGDVFSRETLERLRTLQQDLEDNLPHVGEVRSILNAPYFSGDRDKLKTSSLLDSWPENDREVVASTEAILAIPFYRDRLYTRDRKNALLVLTVEAGGEAGSVRPTGYEEVLGGFEETGGPVSATPAGAAAGTRLTRQENDVLVQAVTAIVGRHQRESFRLVVSGMPLYKSYVRRTIVGDAARFIGLSAAVAALILFLVFRRLSAVLLPFAVVAATLGSTTGLFTYFGRQVNSVTTVFPSLLIAVGVSSCVHILFLFFHFREQGAARERAVALTLEHCGCTVCLANLTTAAGLFSFAAAEVAPIANLGLFGGAGVLLSMFYTLVLLPALLAVLPLPAAASTPAAGEHSRRRLADIVDRVVRVSVTHPRLILGSGLFACALALPGVLQLRLSHNPLTWLPEGNEVRVATSVLDRYFQGVVNVEILVDSRESDGLKSVSAMNRLEKLAGTLGGMATDEVRVGQVSSLVDMVKVVNQALYPEDPGSYRLPGDPETIAQELLLLELGAPSFLRGFADASYRYGRVTVQAPWVDAVAYGRFLEKIERESRAVFAESADITVTGHIPLLSRTVFVTLKSMVRSYLLAGLVITALMILVLGSVAGGFQSMVPNLFPIVVVLGLLGWLGIPLDMLSLLVGCIALGLIVDDTIHFMYNFRRSFAEGGSAELAVQKTMQTAGRALVITSVVLAAAASILVLSPLGIVRKFGLIMGLTVVLALFADIVLAPALMSLLYGNGERRRKTRV